MKKLFYLLLILVPILNLFASDCIEIEKTQINNHFILVVDKSGSMAGEPEKNMKLALYNFLNDMQSNDKASIIFFDDRVKVTNAYTSDKIHLKNSVKNFNAGGGTALYDALGKASILAHENKSQSIIVFFTDGYDNSSRLSVNNIKSIAYSQGIYVYGIALGDVNQRELAKIARKTNGDFMYADNSAQLSNLYQKVLSNYYKVYNNKKTNSSRIIVRSYPSGKSVYLNSRLLQQKTPLVIENLRPGSYSVEVKFDRGNWECSAELFGGYTGTINARENDLGRDIAVISDVKSAMVFIDDNFVGYTSKYPFVSKSIKTGWFSKTTKFNFNKQLIVQNISPGNHVIKIIGLEEVDNFFQPLKKEIHISKKDIIINAEFLRNEINTKETNTTLRNSIKDDPYKAMDDMFDELE